VVNGGLICGKMSPISRREVRFRLFGHIKYNYVGLYLVTLILTPHMFS
jgi:hypothetical protein